MVIKIQNWLLTFFFCSKCKISKYPLYIRCSTKCLSEYLIVLVTHLLIRCSLRRRFPQPLSKTYSHSAKHSDTSSNSTPTSSVQCPAIAATPFSSTSPLLLPQSISTTLSPSSHLSPLPRNPSSSISFSGTSLVPMNLEPRSSSTRGSDTPAVASINSVSLRFLKQPPKSPPCSRVRSFTALS